MSNALPPAPERRPIAARDWRGSRRVASWLVRRGVSPNAISLAGMVCAIGAGAALAATAHIHTPEGERAAWLVAAVLAPLRLVANMLDGMVALESGRASRIGELFNEVPDRVSDAAVLIGLGYARGSELELGYLAAVLAVFTAYVRAAGKVAGAPQFYHGPMAKPQRMWIVTALCLWVAAGPPSLAAGAPAWVLAVIAAGCALTAARRLFLIRNALREPTA